ncbi:Ribosomal protein L6 family protein [Prunus dulcis]|uniref:Ribosomal protein L6 family protein n=1 Tax=Prunus dulcis TaxID=3755 RepID=A0A4Y1RU71_PRUDU|nr:Ribosomal protein L6 family protein [Prunus dulcis]
MVQFKLQESGGTKYTIQALKTLKITTMSSMRLCELAMAAKARNPRKTRNPDLVRGVGKFSRSKMYHKRGLWAIKAKNGGVFPRHDAEPAAVTQPQKPPKFYPADDVKKPLVNKRKAKPTKLRASITPGTVLIILAGRFKGKRVVFLKQLPSGLLLVTGPFKINGVPLRRVNQAYVIGTSTKVDISGVNVEKFDDKYFAKEEKNVIPQGKKDDQKSVDASLIKSIEAVPDLKAYLAARFSLKSGMKPHELSSSNQFPDTRLKQYGSQHQTGNPEDGNTG